MAAIWPFRHFGLKVVSVVLAVFLWLIVAGEETVERGLRVPIEFQQFPEGLEIVEEPPTAVDVRIRGAASRVAQMTSGDITAVIDLREADAGQRLYQITPESMRVPFGVEVVQVIPSTVAMTFERSATKQVPVVPVVAGQPSPGYVIGEITSEPRVVEVVGPSSAVSAATEALTETVNVEGAREPVTREVTVGFREPSLRLANPRRASVTVRIRPASWERTVEGRPVEIRNLDAGLVAEATPATVDVQLQGSWEGLGRAAAGEVQAYVDMEGLGAGQHALDVKVDVPIDTGVISIEPPVVEVTVQRARD